MSNLNLINYNSNYMCADTDLSNLSSTGKAAAAGFGLPSNKYIELSYTPGNVLYYTAPANGWMNLYASIDTINENYMTLSNQTKGIVCQLPRVIVSAASTHSGLIVPLRNGDKCRVEIGSNMTLDYLRFYYTQD